jgi:ribonuclease P protein 3
MGFFDFIFAGWKRQVIDDNNMTEEPKAAKVPKDTEQARSIDDDDGTKMDCEKVSSQLKEHETDVVQKENGGEPDAKRLKVDHHHHVGDEKPETTKESIATATSDGPTKKTNKHIRKKHTPPLVLEIRRRIQQSCKFNDLHSAMQAYEEANTKDIKIEAPSFYSLLNLCDGLERSVHIGTPKPTSNPEELEEQGVVGDPPPPSTTPIVIQPVDAATRQRLAFDIKQRMDDLNLALNETSFTALVKICTRNDQLDHAEKLLDQAEQVKQCRPKLRLYSSLLLAYCDIGRMVDALKLWKRLTKQGLCLSEKECTALMKCATAIGSATVMERVLSNVAEDVLVPCKDTVAVIVQWFTSSHATTDTGRAEQQQQQQQQQQSNNKPLDDDEVVSNEIDKLLQDIQQMQQELEPPPSMGPVVVSSAKGWTISPSCLIDTKTGILQDGCLQRTTPLQPCPLSSRARLELKKMNETIVIQGELSESASEFQGGRKGKKRRNFSPSKRKAQWTSFLQTLHDTSNGNQQKLDVVIDGANIGYYEQNFAGASRHVDYLQIDWIVQHFVKAGKRTLLFLHERHFAPHLLPKQFEPLVKEWQDLGVLYQTPVGMNDDWFWLHAALEHPGTLVVTNDEMRDHHFQQNAYRMFLRWQDRHQVHFSFGAWEETATAYNPRKWSRGEGGRQRKVELVYPEIYSRRIQRVDDIGLVVPLAKRGDENRFLDGSHVATDDEPLEETYLCIRPAV